MGIYEHITRMIPSEMTEKIAPEVGKRMRFKQLKLLKLLIQL